MYGRIRKFTKSDIMEFCPTIGKTSVESSIKQLVDKGVLVKHGSVRSIISGVMQSEMNHLEK